MAKKMIFSDNPLMDRTGPTRFGVIRPDHVGPAVTAAIAEHAAVMETSISGSGFAGVFLVKEHADAALERVWGTVGHLTMVANTPELRAAHAEAQPIMSAYYSAVGQNRALYEAMRAIPREGLSVAQIRALDLELRGFERSGVALDDAPRARFAEISIELGQLSTDFSNAVMDATEAWTLLLGDEARLAGLPAPERAMLASNARAKSLEGWLVDLHFPSVRAITTYADDRALRRTVYEAFQTRASEVGPHAGQFDNSHRIAALLSLRQERAALLGFETPVAWSLAVKMARDAEEVEAFLLDLARRARPRAQAELAELAEYAKTQFGIDAVEPWDISYVSEKLRLARHAIDQAAIKRHLPLPRVLDGLFELVGDLYGVRFAPVYGVETWHADVQYYALHRHGEDAPFAGVYCDFFARAGKRGGAWMDVARPRMTFAGETQNPVAYLVCNFAAGEAGQSAYIAHDEMLTLFHEMGHCLHLMMTEIDLPSVGGIAGVEWDAVELPSQFMENFAWEPAMLRRVSAQAETGEPLPDDMIARMLGARRFLGALALLRQVEFALFDIRLHLAAAGPDDIAPMDVLHAVRGEVAVAPMPEWARAPHSFSHIFAGGYAAGYYSYLWAERLSADAFEAFVGADIDRAETGALFREHILSRGGTRTAAENFAGFRGRGPESAALLRALGLVEDTPT
jgi:oligopeptidase A